MDDLSKVSNQFNLPQNIITLVSNDSGYALDDQNEVFYLLLHVNSSNACAFPFDYNSLVGAEVKEFNSDSGSARKIGRAIVGDVLFGDAGAIVGAVSTSALYNVELIIKTTNLNNPSNVYSLCSYAKQGSIAYESAHGFGGKIVAVVNNISKQYHESTNVGNSPNIDPNHIDATITRIELFLEDKEWQKARTYCDGALDYAPDNSMLYLLRCCANAHQSNVHDFIVYSDLDKKNPDFVKALRFADAESKRTLDGFNQERKCEDIYKEASLELKSGNEYFQAGNIADAMESFIQAKKSYSDISEYKDSRSMLINCKEKIYQIISDKEDIDTIEKIRVAIKGINALDNYKNSNTLKSHYITLLQNRSNEIKAIDMLLQNEWFTFEDTKELERDLVVCQKIGYRNGIEQISQYINKIKHRESEYNIAKQYYYSSSLKKNKRAKELFATFVNYRDSKEYLNTIDNIIEKKIEKKER